MGEIIHSHKDLIVWQKSMDLVTLAYDFTADFPRNEMYGLTMQIRRCSVSIPSNIAEGKKRKTQKDYLHFLLIAYGSGAELETQIEIAKRLNFGKIEKIEKIEKLLEEVMKMLNRMTNNLR